MSTYPSQFLIKLSKRSVLGFPTRLYFQHKIRQAERLCPDCVNFDALYGTETEKVDSRNYGPVLVRTFREAIAAALVPKDNQVFVDIGSGKGRALLLATEFPFRRIIGVEMHVDYCLTAEKNLELAASKHPGTDRIELLCMDAFWWIHRLLPEDHVLMFMYCPLLDSSRYSEFFVSLGQKLNARKAPLTLAFVNPIAELEVLAASIGLRKIAEGSMHRPFWERIFLGWQVYRSSS